MSQNILRVSDIEHFHWALSEADVPSTTPFNGTLLSLAAAVELAAIQAQQHRYPLLGRSQSFTCKNCPLWSLVKQSGWPERRKPLVRRTSEGVAVVIPAQAEGLWWTDCLHRLRNELMTKGFTTKLATGLTGGVAEMVDNVWQHSESAESGLLIYQVRTRKFAFSVVDAGIGVLASLSRNPRYDWLRSSMEAIRLAIQPGVSREDGGGMGFATLLNNMADLWGNARMRSGEAALVIDRTDTTENVRSRKEIYLPPLPGMHVSVRCALDPPRRPSE
jgi:anti-sigma regulatory factor (Ser/Thr protein kinase)